MKSTNWKDIAELLGIAAIVASLIFVGLEMRLTRQLAMAAAYQARTDSEMALEIAQLDPKIVIEIQSKFQSGQELTDSERWQLNTLFNARFMYWENIHYQWTNGLLTDDFWEAQMNAMTSVRADPFIIQYWRQNRLNWREPFRQVVDQIIADED